MRPVPFTISLSEVEYDCPPLTLGQAKELRIGVLRRSGDAVKADIDPKASTPGEVIALIEHNHDYDLDIVATALSHAYPELTREKLLAIPGLTFDELDLAALKVLRASGWASKSGESQAPVPTE